MSRETGGAISCHKLLNSTDDNLRKLSAIAAASHTSRVTPDKIRSQLDKKFDKWLRVHKAIVRPPPLATIDWARLVADAVWRKPPFTPDPRNPDAEKGFRDAIILETVCDLAKTEKRKVNIAFLCNDSALRDAAIARLKSDTRLVAFESLKDFESHLGLTREQLTNEFIGKILSRARSRFYTRGDATSLLERDNVIAQLKERYDAYFDDVSKSDPQPAIGLKLFSGGHPWTPVSPGGFWIMNPEFVRLENPNLYTWKSVVRYVRLYRRPSSTHFTLPGVESSPPTEEKILSLSFPIIWCSKVKADARFYDLCVVSSDLERKDFRAPTEEELKRYNLAATSE